jgi:N-acetylglutamate synthase-like GNAT family acetyltransferase
MGGYQIRPIEISDVESVAAVAFQSWQSTYGNIYPQDVIQQFVSRAYSKDNLTRSVESDSKRAYRLFHVALDSVGDVVAFSHVIPDPKDEESYELVRIYALPQTHGTGVGRALLRHLLDSVPTLTELFAWVERDNTIGRKFYARNGFKMVDEKENQFYWYKTVLLKYTLVRSR